MSDGGISLGEALGQAPVAPTTTGTSSSPAPKGGVSLSEALGTKPAKTLEQKPGFFVKGAKVGFADARDFWTKFTDDVVEQQKSGQSLMKAGAKDMTGEQLTGLKGLGETLLGAVQWGFAGPSALWQDTVSRDLHYGADKITTGVGKALPEKTDSRWVVTKGDLARGGDALADFTDNLLQIALPLGKTGTLSKEALEVVPKELKAEIKARPARDAAKAEAAFDELVVADPDAAQHVTDSLGKFNPEMQKLFDKRWAKFQRASDKELDKIGSDAAKANIEEIEGKLPDVSKLPRPKDETKLAPPGRPGEAGKTPGELDIDQRADAMRHADMLKRVELMQQENSKALEKLSIERPNVMGKHLLATNQLFLKSEDFLNDLAYSRESAGAHEVLDHFIGNAEGPTKDILQRLRKYAPDIKIKFEDSLPVEHEGIARQAAGTYRLESNDIRINRTLHREGLNSAQVIMHELTHAVTARILAVAPAEAKADLENLLKVARERFQAHPMYKGQKSLYGLQDIDEMLAETVSNPKFQQFLIHSEYTDVKSGFKNLYDAVVGKITQMLGLKPESAPLFHAIMKTSEEVMQLQQKHSAALGDLFGSRHAIPDEFDFVTRPKAAEVAKGKMREYWDGVLRNFAPEALSKQAKLGGAYIAKAIAGLAHDDSNWVHKSFDRKLFWAKNKAKAKDFISRYERGAAQATPQLERIGKAYDGWARKIVAQDRSAPLGGVTQYDAVDHYIPRLFDKSEEVERYLEGKFGSSWRAPGFTEERGFKYLDEAIKAGFKPKFDNIEDMFLARQHASDIAEMKLEVMSDLTKNGLAVEKGAAKPPSPMWHSRPAPNGKSYWVHPDVSQILNNAFDSKSLWSMKGLGGDSFRAAMGLKNALVPLKLFGSLFHPLHIATIHNATELTRASASMLAGTDNPAKWLARMVRGSVPLYHSIADAGPGYRLLKAFKGQLKGVTHNDLESLKLMQEGGFIPEMSSQYRTKSIEKFRLAAAEGNLSAAWHLPWAGLQMLQRPIFEQWIPSLKISSYLKDAAEWMKRNPQASDQERIMSLRKISKSIDNRYGEMAYNTLFWKRWAKDIAVADTLSLGWNLGFVREYGGGLLDAGQAMRGGQLTSAAKSGLLDRPLFVALYTTQALAYGGLITWAMTGETPKGLMDYVYPRTGQKDPQGNDSRLQTMFYTREFGAIYKHSQAEGPARGIAETVWNKGSGLMSLASEAIKGVNEWGEQIRDPNGPAYKQIEQTLGHALKELEPISLSAIHGPKGMNQETGLAVAGFTPAGKYVTQSPTQNRINATYNKTYAPRETPYDKAQYSEESRDLRKYWETDQMDKFDSTLADMQEKYKLTGPETRKLLRGTQRGEDPSVKKFSEFSQGDQKALLDKMTPDERDTYLRHANKKLRREYEAPSE